VYPPGGGPGPSPRGGREGPTPTNTPQKIQKHTPPQNTPPQPRGKKQNNIFSPTSGTHFPFAFRGFSRFLFGGAGPARRKILFGGTTTHKRAAPLWGRGNTQKPILGGRGGCPVFHRVDFPAAGGPTRVGADFLWGGQGPPVQGKGEWWGVGRGGKGTGHSPNGRTGNMWRAEGGEPVNVPGLFFGAVGFYRAKSRPGTKGGKGKKAAWAGGGRTGGTHKVPDFSPGLLNWPGRAKKGGAIQPEHGKAWVERFSGGWDTRGMHYTPDGERGRNLPSKGKKKPPPPRFGGARGGGGPHI